MSVKPPKEEKDKPAAPAVSARPKPKERVGKTIVQTPEQAAATLPVSSGEPAQGVVQTAVDSTDGKLYMRHPQLGLIKVSPEDAATVTGLQPVSEQEAEAAKTQQLVRGTVTPADAAVLGLARGASMRTFDPLLLEAEKYLGAGDVEGMRAILQATEEEYPGTTTAGELAGTAAGLVAGGPQALAGKLGAGVAGLGEGAGLAARVGAGAAGAGLEGLAYAPGSIATEAWDKDIPVTGDMVWRHAGGLFGAGAVLGGLGALPGALRDKIRGGLSESIGASETAALTPEQALEAEYEPATRDILSYAATGKFEPEVAAGLRKSPALRENMLEPVRDAQRARTATELGDHFDQSDAAFRYAGHASSGRLKASTYRKLSDQAFDMPSHQATRELLNDAESRITGQLQSNRDAVTSAIAEDGRLLPQQKDLLNLDRSIDDMASTLESHGEKLHALADERDALSGAIESMTKGSKAAEYQKLIGQAEKARADYEAALRKYGVPATKSESQFTEPEQRVIDAIEARLRSERFNGSADIRPVFEAAGLEPGVFKAAVYGLRKKGLLEEFRPASTMNAYRGPEVMFGPGFGAGKGAFPVEVLSVSTDGLEPALAKLGAAKAPAQQAARPHYRGLSEDQAAAKLQIMQAERDRLQQKVAEQEVLREVNLGKAKERHAALASEAERLKAEMDAIKPELADAQMRRAALPPDAQVDAKFEPGLVTGEKSARRVLSGIREARRNIGAASGADRIGMRFTELDYLKRRIAAEAKGGYRLGINDRWGEMFRGMHDNDFKALLENESVWGSKMASFQKDYNAILHDQLNLMKPVQGRITRDAAHDAEFSTWYTDQVADQAKLRTLMGQTTDPLSQQNVAEVLRYVKNNRDLAQTELRYMELSPDQAEKLKASLSASEAFLKRWESGTKQELMLQKIEHGLAHGRISSTPRIAGAVVGGFVGGGPGAAAGMAGGQAVMEMLDPASRLAMLARIENVRKTGDSSMLRWAEKLLGGEGKATGAKAGEVIAEKAPSESLFPSKKGLVFGLMDALKTNESDTDEQRYQHLLDRLEVQAKSAGASRSAVAEMLGPVGEQFPALVDHLANKTQSVAQTLLDLAPKPPPGAGMFAERFQPKLNPLEMDRFSKMLQTGFDPETALHAAVRGEVTPDVVRVLEQMHGDWLARFRMELMDRVQAGNPPPFQQRIALGIMLNLPTDPLLTTEFAQEMNGVRERKAAWYDQQQQQAPRRSYNETGVHLSQDMLTGSQQIERGFDR